MQTLPQCLRRLSSGLGVLLAGVFFLTACNNSGKDAGLAGAPAAPAVTVVAVKSEAVALTRELPGRTAPYGLAEVRPQVTGIIKQRLFREGAEVKAGQPLYQIDPATYQATFDSAKASLARAEANLFAARQKAQRYADLVKIEAVSKQANDDAAAAQKQAEAELAVAGAAVDKARIDLDYTRVISPITGRIGRSVVTPGALVTANQPVALATVQQLDPIYVDVTQSSADLLRLRRELGSGKLKPLAGKDERGALVRLVLEDGSLYGLEGRLEFSEVSVDPATGSVSLRAVFPNPKAELLPGMYVRAQLTQGVRSNAVLAPHAAVRHDPRGNALVMVLTPDNKVEARKVTLDQSLRDQWVVSEGLADGEKIVVEGLQRIRPGMSVKAQEKGEAAAAAPAASATPSAAGTSSGAAK